MCMSFISKNNLSVLFQSGISADIGRGGGGTSKLGSEVGLL